MDELTLGFLRRTIRLHGRAAAAMIGGGCGFGLVLPEQEIVNWISLLSLLAAWVALGWAAADRSSGTMSAILSAPVARRAWMTAILIAAPLLASGVSFAGLASQGLQAAFAGALFSLVYGWMVAALGLCLLLLWDRPYDVVLFGGVLLAWVVVTASPSGEGFLAAWHPITLFKYAIHRAYLPSPEAAAAGQFSTALRGMPIQGMILPLVTSLVAWRWGLRTLDRLEILPRNV